jgi:hypothetical protein
MNASNQIFPITSTYCPCDFQPPLDLSKKRLLPSAEEYSPSLVGWTWYPKTLCPLNRIFHRNMLLGHHHHFRWEWSSYLPISLKWEG